MSGLVNLCLALQNPETQPCRHGARVSKLGGQRVCCLHVQFVLYLGYLTCEVQTLIDFGTR